jgi:hypothetical protein
VLPRCVCWSKGVRARCRRVRGAAGDIGLAQNRWQRFYVCGCARVFKDSRGAEVVFNCLGNPRTNKDSWCLIELACIPKARGEMGNGADTGLSLCARSIGTARAENGSLTHIAAQLAAKPPDRQTGRQFPARTPDGTW